MRRRIITAALAYPPNDGRVCERALDKYPPVNRGQLEPLLTRRGEDADPTEAVVEAEVNHGRWIGRCPFCSSAQIVDPSDSFFICAGADGCMNHPLDGAFVPIVFPADRVEIEDALAVRVNVSTANWRAPETAADLLAENIEHGLIGVR